MSPLFTYLVLLAIVVYGLILLIELVRSRQIKSVLLQMSLLVGVGLFLHFFAGFPTPSTRQSFGTTIDPLYMIGVMFGCIIFGMVANYLFYLKRSFSWMAFLKPMCLSPIVLLPLAGSVQQSSEVEAVQLVSLAILAFQNGFFWKVVVERASANV